MEFTSEVVNFTKIKDGFFLGDESIASNLEVLLQFKISHMINAAGAQVINAWESIGIRYLTLNWSESPNQILFDQKDEIANKIVEFVDEALKSGEGLLVHSLKGQNRACIVVLIYLMKKFRWTLTKSMEFMNNKKYDIDIQKHFLNQLFLFESRLNKNGLGAKTTTFSEVSNENDIEEILLRNTYLNGLENKVISRPYTSDCKLESNSRKIFWADKNDVNRKDLLCNINPSKELYFIKEIKPIMNHKKMIPLKSSIKKRSVSAHGNRFPLLETTNDLQNLLNSQNKNSQNVNFVSVKNNYSSNPLNNSNNINDKDLNFNYNKTAKITNDLNSNQNSLPNNYSNVALGKNQSNQYNSNDYVNLSANNYISNKSLNSTNNMNLTTKLNQNMNISTNSSIQIKRENPNYPGKENKASMNSSSNTNQRSFSYDQKSDKNSNNGKKEVTKIIISPQIQNVFNQNINNIYIQNPSNEMNFDKIKSNQNNFNVNNYQNGNNFNTNINNNINNRPSSVNKRDGNISLNNIYQTNQVFDNTRSQIISSNYKDSSLNLNDRLNKSIDNQKLMQNNYVNNQNILDSKQFKIIDYNTNNNNSNLNKRNNGNKNTFNQNISTNIQQNNSVNNNALNNYNRNNVNQHQGISLNNYNPELNKKNNLISNNSNISNSFFNRPNSQLLKHGPVKIHNEIERKPSTPDTLSTNYYTNNQNNLSILKPFSNNNQKQSTNSNQSSSVIKRSNSFKKAENSNDRPSTAPQKNEKEDKTYSSSINMKRLPSPNLKAPSNNFLGNSIKQNNSSNFSSGLGSSQNYNVKSGFNGKLGFTLNMSQNKQSYSQKVKKK